ncbi:uncharacterized protein BDV14DRAFT_167563 [Aspergillus stella-maris]|uniref:uncharacterized protein n=1 Tax=Aspergillus stella-maris TaxID=1810926 RepID=UPI003CCCF327
MGLERLLLCAGMRAFTWLAMVWRIWVLMFVMRLLFEPLELHFVASIYYRPLSLPCLTVNCHRVLRDPNQNFPRKANLFIHERARQSPIKGVGSISKHHFFRAFALKQVTLWISLSENKNRKVKGS